MWVVRGILHAVSYINELRIYWIIRVSTETHGKVLKIIASLNSDVHEDTNPVIDISPMWVFNFFQFLSNNRCSHEE